MPVIMIVVVSFEGVPILMIVVVINFILTRGFWVFLINVLELLCRSRR